MKVVNGRREPDRGEPKRWLTRPRLGGGRHLSRSIIRHYANRCVSDVQSFHLTE